MSSSRRCVRRAGVRCDRTGSGAYSRGYQLDLAGNRLQGEGATCTFDNANKILTLSGGSVSYDADGNLTSRYATGQPSLWLSWNDLSQVTQVGGASPVTLGYDGLGRRVCATSTMLMSKTFSIFDGDLLLGEAQPSMYIAPPGMPQPAPTITAAYTWGAAGLVSPRRVSAGTSLWYAFGPQGETRQLTSSTGAVVDTYSYTAYGVPLASTGSDPNPFRYGGQAGYYTDPAASGLALCGARWYDPYGGRWLSRDPIGYEGGVNLYEYCDGNPVGALDPSGTDDECKEALREIARVMRDLFGRLTDMALDRLSLAKFGRKPNPKYPRAGTWAGHQRAFSQLQRRLKDLRDHFPKGCGGPPGGASELVGLPVPQDPAEARAAADRLGDYGLYLPGSEPGLVDRTDLMLDLVLILQSGTRRAGIAAWDMMKEALRRAGTKLPPPLSYPVPIGQSACGCRR